MRYSPPARKATLAQRAQELKNLNLLDAKLQFTKHGLNFDFTLQPAGGRRYGCRLQLHRDWHFPRFIVLTPDLHALADARRLPHIYRSKGPGVILCLWYPKFGEWAHQMKLGETYIPWAVEWLTYFEDWLFSDDWMGGGHHGDELVSWEDACAVS